MPRVRRWWARRLLQREVNDIPRDFVHMRTETLRTGYGAADPESMRYVDALHNLECEGSSQGRDGIRGLQQCECSVSGHTLMSDHRFLRYYQVSWTINMVFMFASFDMPPNELRT